MASQPYEMVSRVSPNQHRVLTVGTFDGVHRGHLSIVEEMKRHKREGDTLTAVTFDPHPREFLLKQTVPRLSSLDERAHLLLAAGIDEVIVIPFDGALAAIDAQSFVMNVLIEKIGFHTIVVGHDHKFGRNGTGSSHLLKDMSSQLGFSFYEVPAAIRNDIAISSSLIRGYLSAGDVKRANDFLGRKYARTGVIVRGDGRGRSIGFPTANMSAVAPEKIVPQLGVYAVLASSETLLRAPAVMNIGIRPTFGGKVRTEEVHVLDWDGDLYGQPLTVHFVDRLRDEQKFSSIEGLVNQLKLDVENCRVRLKTVS